MREDDPKMEEIIRLGRLLGWEVGRIIREHLLGKIRPVVETKAPCDYVTDVDRECEKIIKDGIQTRFPDHAIIAEESANSSLERNGITWIIDPLDGTTNFIHGFPMVNVSMAVAVHGNVVWGQVIDPVRAERFEARRGRGAFLNGEPIGVRRHDSYDDALVATGFPFRDKALLPAYLDTFAAIFQRISGVRRTGAAALDLAYLAAGRVDGFWEVGLKIWDVAAGILLVEEAGGRVSDFRGGREMADGDIVAGTPQLWPFLLDMVQRHLEPWVASGRS